MVSIAILFIENPQRISTTKIKRTPATTATATATATKFSSIPSRRLKATTAVSVSSNATSTIYGGSTKAAETHANEAGKLAILLQ